MGAMAERLRRSARCRHVDLSYDELAVTVECYWPVSRRFQSNPICLHGNHYKQGGQVVTENGPK